MKKYMVLYRAVTSAMEQTQNADPEDMKKEMAKWMAWAEKCGDGLVDFGTPLGGGQRMTIAGSSPSEDVVGYSILQAENMEDAKSLMEGHPHLEWGGGCDIEVHESLPTPQ